MGQQLYLVHSKWPASRSLCGTFRALHVTWPYPVNCWSKTMRWLCNDKLSNDKLASTLSKIRNISVITNVKISQTQKIEDLHTRTWLSSPRRRIMKKKSPDHRGAIGIAATALGYTTKAKPGPAMMGEIVYIMQRYMYMTLIPAAKSTLLETHPNHHHHTNSSFHPH